MRRRNLTILCVVTGLVVIPETAGAGLLGPLPFEVKAASRAVLNGMLQPVRHRHHRALALRRWDGGVSAEQPHASAALGGSSVDWSGSVFWPSAYADTFGYILLGENRDGFWSHGYQDIYDGILTPGTVSGARPGKGATDPHIACKDPAADAVGSRAVDRFNHALHLNEPQSARFDGLRQALAKAGERIRASCPNVALLLAPTSRLTAMWERLRALRQAEVMVRLPLRDFYSSLSDEQRAKLEAGNSSAGKARAAARKSGPISAQQGNVCTEGAARAPNWPADEIGRILQPTEAQRPALAIFSGTSARLADMLMRSCPKEMPLTPPGRLDAVEDWLDGLISAVTIERTALGKLYSVLSDEQKAALAAAVISPRGRRRPG
jgi:hypothetical protein